MVGLVSVSSRMGGGGEVIINVTHRNRVLLSFRFQCGAALRALATHQCGPVSYPRGNPYVSRVRKKFSPDSPGQVDFVAGQVTF